MQSTGTRRGMNLALATWVSAINFWAWNMIGPLSTTYAGDMKLSSTEASMLVATPILVGSLGRIVVGSLTDRFGGRAMFIAVSLASIGPVLAVGAAGSARSYPLLLVFGFFLGVAGTIFAVGIPFANNWYEPARRGFATGVFGMGMVGTALSAFFTPRFVRWFGLFATHVIVAVALAVTAVVCIVVMRNAPGFTANTDPVLPKLRAAAKLPVTWEMSFLYAVVFGGFVAFANYLPTYIKTIYGFSPVDAGARTAGFALAAVLARPVGGALSDRIAPKYVVLASFAGTAVMALVAVFQPPPDVWSAATFITLALFLGIGTGGVFAWVARRAPARSVGSVTGIVAAAGGLGGYFPPLVMGATYNAADNNYTIGLLLLVATALIAFAYTALRLHAHEPVRAAPDKESPTVSTTPHVGGPIEELLERSGRFFTPGEFSDDLRTVTRRGGRQGDVFYRDRWSHDKVVRSTHGVNCTGSCSWKVYVKDGIITWETQETDYPSVGPDRPEYEPRGCPRGAAFSWYTYSPTRVRYPYARGVLVEMYREAKARLGDPVLAWADIQADPQRRRRYHRARGKGGLVRVSWAEATELIAAAHVHTIKTYGPDRVAGFSPIPAMSMVSFAAGSRFVELIGGVMTSFYDWYADLPVASPQVFGDQTDVPESGDWWDAAYLVMWGSNVPVTRTPDAHWMAEVRYRGTKVVSVSPDYADNTKFADEWMPCAAGTDGALAMAMGHVILSECFVHNRVPFFVDYVRQYTDLPFLVKLEERDGVLVPGKNLTAADLGQDVENSAFKPVLLDGATDTVAVPKGSLGFRYGDDGVGKWNLDLGDLVPALTVAGPGGQTALVHLPRFDTVDGHGETLSRGVPVRRVGEHLVCTVFDLMLAQYGVARPGLPRDLAHRVRRRRRAVHPGLAGADHRGVRRAGGPRRQGVRPQRRGVRWTFDDHHGRRHLPVVPRRRHLPRGAGAAAADRVDGPQWGRLGALRRAGEVPAGHRVGGDGDGHRLVPPAAADGRHHLLVHPHRSVALRRVPGRRAGQPAGPRPVPR